MDVLACPCGGRLQLIAFIAEATVAKRILAQLGLDSRGPPLARAQAPPDVLDLAPSYVRFLEFVDGKLVKIETGSYGYAR